MLNIASVNMPNIKPETKVLIINNLKSKSPAEVGNVLGGVRFFNRMELASQLFRIILVDSIAFLVQV